MMDVDDPMDVDMEGQNSVPQISWVAPPSLYEASSGLYGFRDVDGVYLIQYTWKSDDENARIQPFYDRFPPSKTSSRWCAWISIHRGPSPFISTLSQAEFEAKFRNDISGLQAEFQALTREIRIQNEGSGPVAGGLDAQVGVTPETIDALAVKYGVLSGKWMIHTKSERVDYLWQRVACVVAFIRGYGQLKVSTRKVLAMDLKDDGVDGGIPIINEGHVICVYVEDYTNKQDVDELRNTLRKRAGVTWKIGFKPDAYTYLDIYKSNPWGLRPSRYHDADNSRGEVGSGLGRRAGTT